MESMAREAWTDERLDDLTHRVDEGFNRNEREFQAVRLEMRTEFAAVRTEIGSLRTELKDEIGSVRGELGSEVSSVRGELVALHRMLIRIAAGGFVTLAAGFLGVIATQL
jgi:HAMP domain-containing protein